ncbi:MAG: AAA family ATPase [Bacillota bacterium]|nr:AAA family ATPase [Bacillota bacterium]
MIENIKIFYGSKKDFEKFVEDNINYYDDTIPFMDLIQHYNARLRPSESGTSEEQLAQKIYVDNCIVRTDDYGSVLEHALANFAGVVTLNHNIGTLFLQNPPKRVKASLEKYADSIDYHYSKYYNLERKSLKTIYQNLENDILGQDNCKKQIVSSLYRMATKKNNKPVVLLLYGPSGVGKTETAKSISKSFGGKLLRVQFSMMQTNEAYNYIFGAEHSKGSFARDMLERESNVILIDEFDKVNPLFYNAFYELFDEGKFVDTNYEVDLKNAIILCTCNFLNIDEIIKALGPAMYSRIGCCIKFFDLSNEQKNQIVDNWYDSILKTLNNQERVFVNSTNILKWFKENINRYDNIRILKTKLENAIFNVLAEEFVLKK